ncbi:MAG: adenylate/guanylate cyclase domain-containing protein [Rhodospirillales bacterium]|nr:adenylate/guanylate cyclase domain-containing protein [Rhodospirillales bacterium]
MSIGQKLFGIVFALLALLAVVGIVSVSRIDRIADDLDHLVRGEMPVAEAAVHLNLLILRQNASLDRLVLLLTSNAPDAEAANVERGRYLSLDGLVNDAIDKARTISDRPHDERAGLLKKWLSRIAEEQDRHHGEGGLLLGHLERGDMAAFHRRYRGLVVHEKDYHDDVGKLRDYVTRISGRSAALAEQEQKFLAILNAVLTTAAAVFGLLLAGAVAAGIVRRVRRLVSGVYAVRGGDLEANVAINGRDEIAELGEAFNEMTAGLRLKERIKDTFGKYIDPRVVAELIEHPDRVESAGQRREATVFFADIKGFTSISEKLSPDDLVTLLNACFEDMVDPIAKRNGVIDKYIGDAVMAFWSPPFASSGNHALDACLAALDVSDAITRFRSKVAVLLPDIADPPEVEIRIGVASGDAIIGSIGSRASKNFTVMGDTVNLSSRLEGVNKQYGTRLMISEQTRRLAGDGVEVREIDAIRVVGKKEPVRVYELLAAAGMLSDNERAMRDRFEAGLAAYRALDLDGAEDTFRACAEISPHDGPVKVFLERIGHLRDAPPPSEWDGVWTLTSK